MNLLSEGEARVGAATLKCMTCIRPSKPTAEFPTHTVQRARRPGMSHVGHSARGGGTSEKEWRKGQKQKGGRKTWRTSYPGGQGGASKGQSHQ